MKTIDGDKLRGHLETMVLSALERGEAHGLEILRRLEHAGCGLLRLKEGSLYPALYRLEAAGKVKVVREETSEGRRGAPRRIYRLTAKGRRELAKGREDWAVFVQTLNGVVGGLTATAKTLSSKSIPENAVERAASPIITGRIGV